MADLERDSSTPQPAAELLPVLYGELRRLAAAMAGRLPPGQTLQATALVHEAYLRLVGDQDVGWNGRRHFFGAAAQAMRDILVEQARRKGAQKRGGGARRVELSEVAAVVDQPNDDVIAVDEAIEALQAADPAAAELIRLRYFAGLTLEEASEVLDRSVSTVQREWRFARAWLAERLGNSD